MTRLIGNFLLDILIIVSECFLSTLVFYTAAVAGSGKFTVGFAGRCGNFVICSPFHLMTESSNSLCFSG